MARKSMKRRNKRHGTSKMQNQQFSRKLFKAIAKGLTRKQKIFGGADKMKSEFIKVTSNTTDSGKRNIDVDEFVTVVPDEGLTNFSKFATDYFTPDNKNELILYLPVIFIVDVNGHRTGLKMINFGNESDKTEFYKLEEQIKTAAAAAAAITVTDNVFTTALQKITAPGTPETKTGTPETKTGTPETKTGTPETKTGTPETGTETGTVPGQVTGL